MPKYIFTRNDMKYTFKSFIALFESRSDFVVQQYGAKLHAALEKDSGAHQGIRTPEEIVAFLVDKADPSKKGTNIGWLAKMYSMGQFKLEDATRIRRELESFEKYRSKIENKDLNSYKTLSQLYDVLEKFNTVGDDELMTKSAKTALVKKDSKVFMDLPGFKVIIPETEEAACLYGAGTKWCTAAKENNMFKHYADQGDLMIVLVELAGKQRKFQFHYESESFMDERDQALNSTDKAKLSELPAYTKFINLLVKKHYGKFLDA